MEIVTLGNSHQVRTTDGHLLYSGASDQEARAFIAGYRACAEAMQGLVRDTNSEVGSALARIAAQTA